MFRPAPKRSRSALSTPISSYSRGRVGVGELADEFAGAAVGEDIDQLVGRLAQERTDALHAPRGEGA